MHNTILEFTQWHLNVLERFGILMDTQAIDVVTFDFKGTRVLGVVSGSTGYQMIFVYTPIPHRPRIPRIDTN